LKVIKTSEVWEEYGELIGKTSGQAQASDRAGKLKRHHAVNIS
jgi:hypothetical protein